MVSPHEESPGRSGSPGERNIGLSWRFFRVDRGGLSGKADQSRKIVRLNFSVGNRAVSFDFAAALASLNQDEPLFSVRQGGDGPEQTAAGIGSVAGIVVNMEGTEAAGTVISRGKSERENLQPAVRADKSVILFSESFLFQFVHFWPPEFWPGVSILRSASRYSSLE